MAPGKPIVVAALGLTQTLAWASTYYLPAILANDMAAAAGVSREWVFGIFSAALLLSAFLGPAVGRTIDRSAGSRVLVASNLVFSGGLVVLAASNGVLSLTLAWTVLGIGMALGLYDAAFAALTGIYGSGARSAITGITLIAGFASTIGWPLTAFLNSHFGWREACLVWATLHAVVGLPLNLLLVRSNRSTVAVASKGIATWEPHKEMFLLAYIFAAVWFVTGAMAAHLPALLEQMGATVTQAITAASLVGPAQVAARLAEFTFARHMHPLVSARVASCLHPAGAVTLAALGAAGAPWFGLMHGAGNGLLTIARGTVPLAIFGPEGYGARTGLLGAPARAAQALAPFLFGVMLDAAGGWALVLSSGLSLSALVALLFVKPAVK
jgi:hypothetical protein